KVHNRAFVGNFVERIGRFAGFPTKFSTKFLRYAVLGQAPGLVPKDSFPTLSSIFVETLCRSSVENGLFRQSFPTKDSDKDSATRLLEQALAIQIFNLPYCRFVIGRTWLAGSSWQVKNLRQTASLRYGRGQRTKLIPRTSSRRPIRLRASSAVLHGDVPRCCRRLAGSSCGHA